MPSETRRLARRGRGGGTRRVPPRSAELCEANFSRRNAPLTPHSPIPLRPFIGRYFLPIFHSKFFLKSPKKRTPRGYFKKFLRFVARLRATFGAFGGISERALIWVCEPRRGAGKQTTPSPKCKRLRLSASFCKGSRLCPTMFLKQQGVPASTN